MMKSVKRVLLFIIISIALQSLSYAQDYLDESSKTGISLNASFSYDMMEHNTDLRKLDVFRSSIASGSFDKSRLLIGTSIIAIADYQHTNTDSKFAYLMRHPTSANSVGNNASEIVLHSMQMSLAGSVNDWIHIYGELWYNPEQSFGTGTITSVDRNRIELRKGIIMIANPNKFPVYLSLGKMDTPFGLTGSVNPFTNSTMWHAFGGLAYSGTIGIEKYGLNASFTAIQGGAQFRALNVPVDSTNVPSRLNNFAFDINYTISQLEKANIKVGFSYMKGSAYVQDFPITHFSPGKKTNPAYSYYAQLRLDEKFLIQWSFAKTTDVWPGTQNPFPPLDIYEATAVSSLSYGFKFDFLETPNILYSLSGEFSNFRAGAEDSPWERQNQLVAGLSAMYNSSSVIFLEIFSTKGYAPLNFISGGNFEDPGLTHSDRDASSIGFVIGVQGTI
ncbi:MAG: hypothetical protein HKN67_00615 [Saprospiraceae bacterium]|nr:hypothetical protein [Saprospiraceae bacterium]